MFLIVDRLLWQICGHRSGPEHTTSIPKHLQRIHDIRGELLSNDTLGFTIPILCPFSSRSTTITPARSTYSKV